MDPRPGLGPDELRRLEAEHNHGWRIRLMQPRDHRAHGVCGHEGHIAVQDQHIAGEARQRALGLFGEFDQDAGIRDIEATIHHIRRTLGVAKVGCVGYCLGGRLAYMTAARTDIDASVGYYGVGIDGLLHEKHAIAHPLMLHIPTEDGFVPRETQAAMHAGLGDHPKVTLHDYDGLDHGFATETGQRRNEAAATLADSRTAAFFAEHLG